MPNLFDPIEFGAIATPNRIVMAPLTRGRATADHVPTPIMTEYYRQRAGAGLIITEATGISREGLGWPHAPGLWTRQQVEAWKPVTEAVHNAGGRIMVQLWHMGRLARRSVTGQQPISSSPTTAPGRPGEISPYEEARPATAADLARVVEDFGAAARNALEAGFDGVQLHAANGYLIDQFLRNGTNFRDDDYGGSPENRIRLLREAVERVIAEIGADRTSVRLSPNGDTQGTDDSDPELVFLPAAQFLSEAGIAFLELRELTPGGTFGASDVPPLSPRIRPLFKGPLVLNQDYDATRAQQALDSGVADAIAFGRPWISNPDLPERFRRNASLNEPDQATFYSTGPTGYIDYPVLAVA